MRHRRECRDALRRVQNVVAADLRVSRLEDALPEGNFDLVVSALAVHHLDGAGKADLFARVAARLPSASVSQPGMMLASRPRPAARIPAR